MFSKKTFCIACSVINVVRASVPTNEFNALSKMYAKGNIHTIHQRTTTVDRGHCKKSRLPVRIVAVLIPLIAATICMPKEARERVLKILGQSNVARDAMSFLLWRVSEMVC
jgi:hypothetical protein